MALGANNPYNPSGSTTGGMSAGIPVMEPGGGYQGNLSNAQQGPTTPVSGSGSPFPSSIPNSGWISSAYNQSPTANQSQMGNWWQGLNPTQQGWLGQLNAMKPRKAINQYNEAAPDQQQLIQQLYGMLPQNMQSAWSGAYNRGGMNVGGADRAGNAAAGGRQRLDPRTGRPMNPHTAAIMAGGGNNAGLKGQTAPYPFNLLLSNPTGPNHGWSGVTTPGITAPYGT